MKFNIFYQIFLSVYESQNFDIDWKKIKFLKAVFQREMEKS